tara:strand:- start:264 stop:1010 length:747 start_codon:yes stop_codon:yes gene_type:complete
MTAEIIEQLRDDDKYYGEFGRQFLSNSDIYALLNCPEEFGVPKGANLNLLKGSYLHHLVLEPEKAEKYLFVDATTRSTKVYKSAVEDEGEAMLLLYSEKRAIEMLVSKIKGNFEFCADIYDDRNEYEVPSVGEIFGHMWKGKADIITPDKVIDIKTTSKIGARGKDFMRSARAYNYDSQAYIYNQLFGKPVEFYVVEKDTGRLAVADCDEEFLDRGREKVLEALSVYKMFFGDNPREDISQYIERIRL